MLHILGSTALLPSRSSKLCAYLNETIRDGHWQSYVDTRLTQPTESAINSNPKFVDG